MNEAEELHKLSDILNKEVVQNAKIVDQKELTRNYDNDGRPLLDEYISIQAEVRNFIVDNLIKGNLYKLNDPNHFIQKLLEIHVIASKEDIYKKSSDNPRRETLDVNSGSFRSSTRKNERLQQANHMASLAGYLDDHYKTRFHLNYIYIYGEKTTLPAEYLSVKLNNIPEQYWPKDIFDDNNKNPYVFSYPAPEAIPVYMAEINRIGLQISEAIKNKDKNLGIELIAKQYQLMAIIRPFRQINNSIFMNFANAQLKLFGLKGIQHLDLDFAAQRLQTDNFVEYFKHVVHETQIGEKNIPAKRIKLNFVCKLDNEMKDAFYTLNPESQDSVLREYSEILNGVYDLNELFLVKIIDKVINVIPIEMIDILLGKLIDNILLLNKDKSNYSAEQALEFLEKMNPNYSEGNISKLKLLSHDYSIAFYMKKTELENKIAKLTDQLLDHDMKEKSLLEKMMEKLSIALRPNQKSLIETIDEELKILSEEYKEVDKRIIQISKDEKTELNLTVIALKLLSIRRSKQDSNINNNLNEENSNEIYEFICKNIIFYKICKKFGLANEELVDLKNDILVATHRLSATLSLAETVGFEPTNQ